MTPSIAHATRTDTGLAAELRVGVMRLARRLRTERSGDLSLASLSVLGVLMRNEECTLGALADYERVKPPSMTRTVRCLEEAGLVRRRADDSDGRQSLVSLTQDGVDYVHAERRRRDAWLTQRMGDLTAEERATLRAAAPIIERLANTD